MSGAKVKQSYQQARNHYVNYTAQLIAPDNLFRLFSLGLTVLLSLLCLPSGPFSWLSFMLLVPFGLCLRGLKPYHGCVWGLAFGTCIWATASWWMRNAFAAMLHLPEISAWAMAGLFWLYMGLPYAAFGWIYARLAQSNRHPAPLMGAALLTLLVAVRTSLGPATIHQGLASWPYLVQTADIGGRHLVLFLLVLGNFLLVETCVQRTKPLIAGKYLLTFFLLLGGILGYGALRLEWLHKQQQQAGDADSISVTSLQPMIETLSGSADNTPSELTATVSGLVTLTREAWQNFPAADLVLWPEIPRELPCDCQEFKARGIHDAASDYGSPILLSCTEFPDTAGKYNAAWAIRPNAGCGMAYQKIELVPFGEFIPFERWYRELIPGNAGTDFYMPGRQIRLLQLRSGKRILPLICYESGFPALLREGLRQGADLVAVLSDDIWFASAKAETMHLDMTLFRAVEIRRPLVSCTNSGISAHIRATGEIVPGTQTRSGVRTATHARLYCPTARTLYSRIGDTWLWLLAFLLVIHLWRTRSGAGKNVRN